MSSDASAALVPPPPPEVVPQIPGAAPPPEERPRPTGSEIAAWVITALALGFVLAMHLLPALLSGLLVFELVHQLAPRLPLPRGATSRAKTIAVLVLAVLVITVVVLAVVGLVAFFRSEQGSLTALLQKMAEIVGSSRPLLPESVSEYLPADADGLKRALGEWLHGHAGELQHAGAEVGKLAAHALVGMVIGAMVALHDELPDVPRGPLTAALVERAARVAEAFRRVVFAQVRIAALNAVFTGIFLLVGLRIFGVELPLAKTMTVFTFVAGLVPVLGNLVSNTVIVIVASSHSLGAAIAALVFLVVIHKLEYFLNARIVGTQIRAKAFELLLAMLVMETAFGIAGVVAAPIYYAYLKDELTSRGLV